MRGGFPTRTRSYRCHRSRATWSVAARSFASRAARATVSMRSRRSSRGDRFHRAHLGQMTQSRPFHSSNAMRRPTPRPEGPPSPSSLALQKAQVVYIGRQTSDVRLENVLVRDGGERPCGAQRGEVYIGFTLGEQVPDDLPGERREQDAVAAVAGGVIETG